MEPSEDPENKDNGDGAENRAPASNHDWKERSRRPFTKKMKNGQPITQVFQKLECKKCGATRTDIWSSDGEDLLRVGREHLVPARQHWHKWRIEEVNDDFEISKCKECGAV